MKIEVTQDVAKHHSNEDYFTILVTWAEEDTNFFQDKTNWTPRSVEAFALFKAMFGLDPKFRSLVLSEFDIRPLQLKTGISDNT